MKKRLLIGLLVLIAGVFLNGCGRPQPDAAAEAFLTRLQNGQYEEMYQQLTLEARERVSKDDFINRYKDIYRQMGKLSLDLGIERPARGRWVIKDNRVSIPVKGEMETWTVGTLPMNHTLHLVYQHRQWLIDWLPTNIIPQLTDWNYRVQVTRTPAERGSIYDRNGDFLIGTGTIYRIGLVPGKMKNWDETVREIARLLHLTPSRVEQALKQQWVRPDHFVPLRSITQTEWLAKRDQFLAIPGVLASSSQGRAYVGPESLSTTLGYLGEINQRELQQWEQEGYRAGDLVGRAGLEERFNRELSGTPGFMIRVVDQAGQEQSLIKFTRNVKGQDLGITIDTYLQRIIENAMGDRRGVGVALSPWTGEVLALVSMPGFDANEFLLGSSSTRVSQILKDPANPMLNRAIQGKYIPGSTFKVVTALAALEFDADYSPLQKVEIPEDTWRGEAGWGGYRVRRVPRPAGPVDLYSAMKWSDNIYFAQLAYKMGSEPLFKMSDRLGFSTDIPFPLNVAKSTLVNQRPITNSITLADTGYGQGQIIMTPLHMTMIYAAIATDGKLRQPVLLANQPTGQIWGDAIASPENLSTLKEVLKITVQDESALAYKAHIPGLDIAGKTGTAQTGNNKETGWFICYLPASNPELVLLIGIEDAVKGSNDAMEVARKVLTEYYQVR